MSAETARHLVNTDTAAAVSAAKRDPWVVTVCKAGRAALEKALAVSPRLGATEMRVVVAVVDLTALWSKLSDEVYLGQVAELANIGGSEENQRKATGRALRRCAQLGILLYEPGDGRGNPSTIGLPSDAVEGGLESSPLNDTTRRKGGWRDPKGGLERSERGGAEPPHPRRDLPSSSESSSEPAEEEEPDPLTEACRLVAERRLALRTGKPITNRHRWLAAVAAEVRTTLTGQDLRGLSAEAIADRAQPMPGPLYAEAAGGARASPWTELADGTVVAAADRGG